MNLNDINDVKELKALLADSFTERENARAVEQQSNQNIQLISQRIREITEKEPDEASPKK